MFRCATFSCEWTQRRKRKRERVREIEREVYRKRGKKSERAGLKVTSHCPNSSFKTTKEAKTVLSLSLCFPTLL